VAQWLVNFASDCSPYYKLLLENLIDETVRNSVLVLEPKVRRMEFFSPQKAYNSGLDWVVGSREPPLLHGSRSMARRFPRSPSDGTGRKGSWRSRSPPWVSFPKP